MFKAFAAIRNGYVLTSTIKVNRGWVVQPEDTEIEEVYVLSKTEHDQLKHTLNWILTNPAMHHENLIAGVTKLNDSLF